MANKLELTWVGKENEIKVEPRILIENPALSNMSHKMPEQASIFDVENTDSFDNMLIHGDNLLALKALESKFAGQVKCIYIDPPYNTGSAFEHYDDGIEHSIWLNLMYNRLLLLKNLLHKTEGKALEKLHYQIWQYAKSDYQSVAEQIIGFKKESLSSSQAARKRTIEDRLQKETNPRIIRMKQSQLASQESNYREKLNSLNEEIRQSDIVTRKLVIGILKVEN